jgi:hypothetical protein
MSCSIKFSRAVQLLVATTVLGSPCVLGYEIDTHARMTKSAHDQSVLNKNVEVRRALGLLKSRKASVTIVDDFNFSLGLKYKDIGTTPPATRDAKPYDEINVYASGILQRTVSRWDQSRFDGIAVPYFPVDWMARGAVREDDAATLMTTLETVFGDSNAPDMLDANPKINRFCNHFYDPINNGKLELGGSPLALFACGPSEVFSTGVQWVMGASTLRFVEAHKSTRPPTGKGVFHV